MRVLQRIVSQIYVAPSTISLKNGTPNSNLRTLLTSRVFSTKPGDGGNQEGDWGNNKDSNPSNDYLGWDVPSSWSTGWSTGFTKESFGGEVIGQQTTASGGGGGAGDVPPHTPFLANKDEEVEYLKQLKENKKEAEKLVKGWNNRLKETSELLKQVREPGARGSYLKDSEKAEMYRLHKENPEVYTVEKLAEDYRIMRQRVHAILWLKEDKEQQEKKLGRPLDDSNERLLDNFLKFYVSHDREYHIATLPYKPDFKVMPEGWDGTTRDPDEVHYEISMKEDDMLYQEFVQRMNFNKMKLAGKVKCHKHSRRRPDEGWNIMVEKLGPRGKRGKGGGWKFMSKPDGSTRPLNELETMFVMRETPRRRKKLLVTGQAQLIKLNPLEKRKKTSLN